MLLVKIIQVQVLGIALLIFGALFSPTPVSAQGLAQLAGCTGPDCGTCQVINLANGIIMWLIGFIFLLFALLLVRAGVNLVTSGGNPGALQAAKDNFINAIIGFIIILAAWLIVDTVMRALISDRSGALVWSEITCTKQVESQACTKENGCVEEINFDEINVTEEFISATDALPVPPGSTGSSCGVNEGALVPIPGQGGRLATPDVANRFVSMQRSLDARGIRLSVTSSYRSDARQTELWDECPVCQRERTVARPCSRGGNGSRHTSGVALDLTSNGSRADIVAACRAAGARFTMTYQRSGHVHCDWR